MFANPAMVRGVTVASVPPVIMTSASPPWISRMELPRACALDEQADTVA
jgi:hypothetical protein